MIGLYRTRTVTFGSTRAWMANAFNMLDGTKALDHGLSIQYRREDEMASLKNWRPIWQRADVPRRRSDGVSTRSSMPSARQLPARSPAARQNRS